MSELDWLAIAASLVAIALSIATFMLDAKTRQILDRLGSECDE